MSINPIDSQVMFLNQAVAGKEVQHAKNHPAELMHEGAEKIKEESKENEEKVADTQDSEQNQKINDKEEKEKHQKQKEDAGEEKKEKTEGEKIHDIMMTVDPSRGKHIDILK